MIINRDKIRLSQRYNEASSFLNANGLKVYRFKAKVSKIKPLYWGHKQIGLKVRSFC